MASPPRYVPTLTEVVAPESMFTQPAAQPSTHSVPHSAPFVPVPMAPSESVIDHNALTQSVIDRFTPQLEAHLRSAASDLMEMHLREVLPALQMALEAEVRRAVDEALAQRLA